MGDGIGSGGAGIGNNEGRAGDAEGPLHQGGLLLGLIINRPAGLATPASRGLIRLLVKGFPQRHPAGGGAEDAG